MKTKCLILSLLCLSMLFPIIVEATPTVDRTSDRDITAPAAGRSAGGIYSNYGITGEPTVGTQDGTELAPPNDTWNNYFGYFYGLDYGVSLSTKGVTIVPGDPTTALSGGLISDDGGFTVIARGICWSTATDPTTASHPGGGFTTDGTGAGTFTSTMTGLTPGVMYYIRAYSTNASRTVYGDNVIFTSVPTLPEWGLIALITVVAGFGGLFVWRKLS